MRFPIYPDIYRKLARITLKTRKPVAVLSFISVLILILGGILDHNDLVIAGIVFSFIFAGLLVVTIGGHNVLFFAEIGEDMLRIVDEKGNVLRSTEYRHIRHMEVRIIALSLVARERSDLDRVSYQGWEGKMIMVYIDTANCFEDLTLYEIRGFKGVFYPCDELMFHPNCIALAYDERAWELLQKHLYQSRNKVEEPEIS